MSSLTRLAHMVNLSTTNALLGIMAAVSVLEAVAFVAILTGGFLLYRRVTQAISRSKSVRWRRRLRASTRSSTMSKA